MKLKILHKFIFALVRDWIAIIGCMAVLVFISLLFWAETSMQVRAFALSAVACLGLISIRIWAVEFMRAEKAAMECKGEPRPRVTVDGYSVAQDEKEQGEEYLVETLRIINRGDAPAIGVMMRPLQMSGRTARWFSSIPMLKPGESTEVRVLNLRRTLERAAEKATKSKGHSLSVRLPLIIECQDLQHERWITDHAVLFGIDGIRIDVVRASESPKWTSIAKPRGF
jgi:hypothetical protein